MFLSTTKCLCLLNLSLGLYLFLHTCLLTQYAPDATVETRGLGQNITQKSIIIIAVVIHLLHKPKRNNKAEKLTNK